MSSETQRREEKESITYSTYINMIQPCFYALLSNPNVYGGEFKVDYQSTRSIFEEAKRLAKEAADLIYEMR